MGLAFMLLVKRWRPSGDEVGEMFSANAIFAEFGNGQLAHELADPFRLTPVLAVAD